jgi:hypothetical protein
MIVAGFVLSGIGFALSFYMLGFEHGRKSNRNEIEPPSPTPNDPQPP